MTGVTGIMAFFRAGFFCTIGVSVVLAAGLTAVSACNPIDEKVCSSGSYPVKDKGDGPGQTCVKSGDPIPSGYTTYAPGQTPTTP